MTQEDLAELAHATKELKEKQETPDPPEALKAVPSLSLHDIPKKPTHVPIEVFFCGLDLLPIVCLLFSVYYVAKLQLCHIEPTCQPRHIQWQQQSCRFSQLKSKYL
jgi:hypothetical protein